MSEYAAEYPRDEFGRSQEQRSEPKKPEPYSHVLMLADGSRVEWAADDMDPHAAVPTQVNGVPVVAVAHAFERTENE